MNPEEYTEDIQHEDVTNTQGPQIDTKITDILEEDINETTVEQNTTINDDDFEDSDGGSTTNTSEDPEEKTVDPQPDPPVTKKDPPAQNDPKNKAVARLMNPATILSFYNIVAGRIGKSFNTKNPDCLKFDQEDTEDIGLILKDTVEEENWSRFPSKYLLLIVLALIIVGKIMSWNKAPVQRVNAGNSPNPELEKQVLELTEKISTSEKLMSDMLKGFEALKEQNELLKSILENKTGMKTGTTTNKKIFKGHDLSDPDLFTENGAIRDRKKIGQKGYTSTGVKMGIPSQEEKETYAAWKLYQENMNEEFEAA